MLLKYNYYKSYESLGGKNTCYTQKNLKQHHYCQSNLGSRNAFQVNLNPNQKSVPCSVRSLAS